MTTDCLHDFSTLDVTAVDSGTRGTSLEAAAAAGDRHALAQLLVEHSGMLTRRLAARLELNPFADFGVEDLLQEVFLDVIRGIGAFRPDHGPPFQAWLLKVADNRLAAMLRARSRIKRGGRQQSIPNVGAHSLRPSVHGLLQFLADQHGETGSAHVARAEVIQAVRQGLLQLPLNQRAAIEARYLADGGIDGEATGLAKTEGAMRGLLHRAKASLRGALGTSSRWFYRK